MSFLHILSVIVLFEVTQCADILLQPYAYGMTSRLRDEVKMVELLTARGHHVTVLINNDDKKVMDHIEVRTQCASNVTRRDRINIYFLIIFLNIILYLFCTIVQLYSDLTILILHATPYLTCDIKPLYIY